MPVRYAKNDNRITYGKTLIKSIMQGETAVYGEDVFAKQPLFTYSETQNSVTITGLTDLGKTRENIIVPSEYNGKAVTYFSSTAFNNATNLKSVVIPNSVITIGEGAFSGCSVLESITIPFVGGSKDNTSSDTPLHLFGYIFGTNSFDGAERVTQWYFTDTNPISRTVNYYIPSSLRSVIMTGGKILNGVFYNCSMLTSIAIPDNVTSIDENAFRGCAGLTSITIPDSVTSIGNYAFEDCTGLTEINWNAIEVNDFSVGSYVFRRAGVSKDGIILTFSDSVKKVPEYFSSAVNDSPNIKNIIIGEAVTSIGDYAFERCNNLTYVIIGGAVVSIGAVAFAHCTGLTSITIPDSVTSIGNSAFSDCSGLTSMMFEGTIAEWNTIDKGGSWHYNCPFTEVVCSDGTVSV